MAWYFNNSRFPLTPQGCCCFRGTPSSTSWLGLLCNNRGGQHCPVHKSLSIGQLIGFGCTHSPAQCSLTFEQLVPVVNSTPFNPPVVILYTLFFPISCFVGPENPLISEVSNFYRYSFLFSFAACYEINFAPKGYGFGQALSRT